MAVQSFKFPVVDGISIVRKRREELGLTINAAAKKAHVGLKTWSRYESGEPVRQDKVIDVLRALNLSMADVTADEEPVHLKDTTLKEYLDDYRTNPMWSKSFVQRFGIVSMIAFIRGAEDLLAAINNDLDILKTMPAGSHLGMLVNDSYVLDQLPAQFVTRYDYDFLYSLKSCLLQIRERMEHDEFSAAHTVLEEIVLLNIANFGNSAVEDGGIMNELLFLLNKECIDISHEYEEAENEEDSEKERFFVDDLEDWVYEFLGDDDVETYLYGPFALTPDNPYHFDHWMEHQFYMGNASEPAESDD